MTDLVSIIMPTFNRADLLSRAVNSVFAQTHANWELIIIADGCTDTTKDIVRTFLSDPRLTYIELTNNVGGAEARNIGLRHARGEYLAFLDDDDEWLPRKLQLQIQAFKDNPDAAIISCNYYRRYDSTDVPNEAPSLITLHDLLYANQCGSFSFCMTRRVFIQSLEIERRLRACQDWDLWIKILKQTDMQCRVLQEYLVRYYEHPYERLTTNIKKYYSSYLLFLRSHVSLMNRSQRKYNFAFLSFYKSCSLDDNIGLKLKLAMKAVRYGLGSGRVSVGGYISYFALPLLSELPGGEKLVRSIQKKVTRCCIRFYGRRRKKGRH